MDESLSDFQEKKQSCTGPKKVSKAKLSSIKKRKQIKGQRDIRSLVKSKKNELVTYTKDFDQMCKSSGIDVDSEQLQLAIALSKSLQDTETQVDEETLTVKSLSAVERTRKIKTTLQEYGFKVPSCVLKKTSKRSVSNKKYQLLTTPDSKRKDITCTKYFEVLRRNQPTLNTCSVIENTDKEIYNKSTNIPYNKIKNIDEFYIGNSLIEKSSHTTSLLKDWSAIPGRPVSPDLKTSNFKFYEFEFTQDELDCLLSSPLQLAQEVIKRKRNCDYESTQKTVKEDMNTQINPNPLNENMDAIHRARSASPDLFEDDYSIEESTYKQLSQKSQNKTSTCTTNKTSIMDLTECVSSVSYKEQNILQSEICIVSEISKQPSFLQDEKVQLSIDIKGLGEDAYDKKDSCRQSSQINSINTNIQSQTRLSSETIIEVNDFMEVTECVVSSSFKYNRNLQDKSMSRTTSNIENQSGNNDVQLERSNTSINKNNHKDNFQNVIENVDLTQSMVESVNCLKEVINLTEDIERSRTVYNEEIESISMDLTQSSNSNEDLPVVQISGKNASLDDTIIFNDDDDRSNNISAKDTGTAKEIIQYLSDDTSNDNISLSEDCLSNSKMQTHKDSIDVLSDTGRSNTNSIDNDDTIDLTQSPEISTQTYHSSESLGKQNNVSIDYDELYDMIAPTTDSIVKSNYTIQSIDRINNEKFGCKSAKSLQKGVPPEICSPEITKNIFFDSMSTGQLSDEERLSDEGNINTVPLSDSNLPNVEAKSIFNNIGVLGKNCDSTPPKLSDLSKKSVDHTPTNDDYIIKTNNVTPILDYESMTTPARNKELEKYGLKPFKRKRAIQLLTYLYNQTHPVVEECALYEIPSTSKKIKVDKQETNKFTTNTTHKNRKKTAFEDQDLNKENLYSETKENPDIKDIECCPEDWFFQTREKAKVHSCRVPLHIVFHNYVSCRSMLRAAILRYEPINIDVIHKDLIAKGFRYNPKELLKFMDKKCITVRTAENKTRNQKI